MSLPDPAGPSGLDPTLDAAPCGFLRLNDAGVVVAANATFLELIGRDRVDVTGHPFDGVLSAAGRIFYSTHLFPLLRIDGRVEELYVPVVHADGTEIPMLVNGRSTTVEEVPVHDLVLVPMRERNRLEDELIAARSSAEEAAAAKDRFLSIVSHELRSPLSGITGYAELLLRERTGPLTESQRRYVERIRDAGFYQAGLIEDILDFAAIGERREVAPLVVPVEEVLARAESILAVRAKQEARRLIRRPKPAPGEVVADPRGAQQILLNLGMNAIKYGRERTPVEITAERVGARVEFRVRDSGGGIPPDKLESIFQPFVQLEARGDATAAKRGVGLGLAISRDLARAMRGDIRVESVLGEGSTFTLDLPAPR